MKLDKSPRASWCPQAPELTGAGRGRAHFKSQVTQEAGQVELCEGKVSLVEIVTSRTVRVIERNPFSKIKEGREKERRKEERNQRNQ